MTAWRRMWARTALFLAVLLVSAPAFAAAQLCWSVAHEEIPSASGVPRDDSPHHGDCCPGAWLASAEPVTIETALLPDQRSPAAPVSRAAILPPALATPTASVALAHARHVRILFGNLRL